MLNIIIKSFDQLTLDELYELLQLRSAIFVVEQNCVYQDIDGMDKKALHVMGYKKEQLVAYTRVFKPNDYFEAASIGRVLVKVEERHLKYGYDIMHASITSIKERYGQTTIEISAQTYLKQFYISLGFKQVGSEYLEDGIPHIRMLKI